MGFSGREELGAAPGAELEEAAHALSARAGDLAGRVVFHFLAEGISPDFPEALEEFLPFRKHELVPPPRDDDNPWVQVTPLDRDVGDRAYIDLDILDPERGVKGKYLEIEAAIGELEHAARGNRFAYEIHRFLHEKRGFTCSLQ
jgi:hypothetical protein